MYFFRMVHISEDKITGRGIGNYVKKTYQPSAGKKNAGGQKLGEMEVSCLIAKNGTKNLNEFMTTKSDSINAKINWLIHNQDCLCGKELNNDEKSEPETVKLLSAYLKVLGVEFKN